MELLIVLACVLVWYGMGLVGSAIYYNILATHFPLTTAASHKEDFKVCLLLALFGISNIFASFLSQAIWRGRLGIDWGFLRRNS